MTQIPKARNFDGKTFFWDGEEYVTEEEARATEKKYRQKGFEVQRLSAGGRVHLYTRRPVSSTASPDPERR